MQVEGQVVIDDESRELLAVHHTGFIVAEAGQIYRGYTNSDHGIDGEVAQLRSSKLEARNPKEIRSPKFEITRCRVMLSAFGIRASFGFRDSVFGVQRQRAYAYAVMLVIRTSDGDIRWMDVSAYLKRESAGGKTVKQIIFAGERFDAVSVQKWRKKVLGGKPTG